MSCEGWILFGIFVLIMGLMDYALCKIVSRDEILNKPYCRGCKYHDTFDERCTNCLWYRNTSSECRSYYELSDAIKKWNVRAEEDKDDD